MLLCLSIAFTQGLCRSHQLSNEGSAVSQLARSFGKSPLDCFGLDQFHTEHWITSHPMVQPCDLSMAGQLKPWLCIPSAHKQQQHS